MNTALIIDFIQTARLNGVTNLWAHLPRTQVLIRTNQVAEIRKVKDCLAFGFDELGNRISLTTDRRIIQGA
jgi:hypothetical protein